MKYNYCEAIRNDVLNYIKENYTIQEQIENLEDRDEWEEKLNDGLWVEDSVTGNASGSYTFNRCQAREYVIEWLDVLKDALEDFGTPSETIVNNFLNEEWEYFDVTIRCYLLGGAINKALDELEEWYNNILPIAKEN